MNTLEDFFDYCREERPSEISDDKCTVLRSIYYVAPSMPIQKRIEKIRRANEVIQKNVLFEIRSVFSLHWVCVYSYFIFGNVMAEV